MGNKFKLTLKLAKTILYLLILPEKKPQYLSHRKLEDLKVLRRSPDLLNNVKIGQG